MSKFRKWLIKKLGGFTKEDLPIKPIEIKQQNVQLVPITVIYPIDQYTIRFFNENGTIERNISSMIAEKIKPELVFIEEPTINGFENKFIKAKILIPSNYVKESE